MTDTVLTIFLVIGFGWAAFTLVAIFWMAIHDLFFRSNLERIDEAICTLYQEGIISLEEAERRLAEAIREHHSPIPDSTR